MFRFEYIEHLYYLALLVPLVLAFIWYVVWRRRSIAKLGEIQLVDRLMPERSVVRHPVKFILAAIALASLVVAYANPQMGSKYEKVKRKGIELIVALDVSRSMMAEDVKPNRLERAKQFISKLIEKTPGDKVGLIVFAGNSYLQVPITVDHSATKLLLNTVSPEMVPTQGTDIGGAIHMALRSYEGTEKKHKALVIISDGEDQEDDALTAADDATNQGVVIHTIGIGDPQGAPIPEYKGGVQANFKRDENGNIVLTKLNEQMLQQIALKGNGKYFHMSSGNDELNQLLAQLNGMEKKENEEKIVTDYESQFQYFIIVALFLLTLEFFISERKGNWVNWNKIFG